MVSCAARVSPRLFAEIEHLAGRPLTIAEIYRHVGAAACRLGVSRPSYERVRLLVHEARRKPAGPGTAEVVADVILRARAPQELVEHAAGIGLRPLRPGR